MSLAGVAKETLAIIEAGGYVAPSGQRRELRDAIDRAVAGTKLFRAEDHAALLARAGGRGDGPRQDAGWEAGWGSCGLRPRGGAQPLGIDVSTETTAAAARRLAGTSRVCALNFASARNPGGGFLGGAKAQEEDLARCSALYTCQLTQRAYYDDNRACASMVYLDHIIYSPQVPFFRDDRLDLIEAPFACSVITAPAPNAGQAFRHREPMEAVSRTLHARAGMVLAVAAEEGERCLVLGAWGCGVFKNDPGEVARAFAEWLASPRFAGAFDHVTFAIPAGRPPHANLRAFQARFGQAS